MTSFQGIGCAFGPFFERGGPSDLNDDGPEGGGDEGVAGVVEKSDGDESEDKAGVIPIPKVLMEDEENEEGDEDDPFFVHKSCDA